MRTTIIAFMGITVLSTSTIPAGEFHVSNKGDDLNPGTQAAPLRTIQRAADLAQPGDVITVHKGTYRERVTPPRGGESDAKRIVYQAAAGKQVEIKGSEVVTNWVKVQDEVWKATLPNAFFGRFNPYSDLIRGDWFDPKGREHHTGAVYLNGNWLIEAARLDDLLKPTGTLPPWLTQADQQYLLNVAWLRPGKGAGNAGRISATGFAAQHGIQTAPCSEGGECIGWVEPGDWVRFERVDFGRRTEQMEIRAASATDGGIIEIRLEAPDGKLLGTCPVGHTGDWQSWSSFNARIKPVSGVKTLCLLFKSHKTDAPKERSLKPQLWFAQVDASNTTIWAQFKGVDPNEQLVEINVRRTVFYPEKPGMNYITVRGFTLRHAATPWAPPTAEQVGLIGTHWSKGWIIENNIVSHSTCSGIALGKYGDEWDNTSANTAEGYVKTIERALQNGWNQETIGHHIVRNNTISHCEQAGIVGSLGAAFSTVTGNSIHDIHVRRLFTGAEMAGIKFHAAIDTTIRSNHIYRTCRGLWLDWMAQGTRVSGNLFHNNASEDLFVEVNHGPFLVDNNLFLSAVSLLDMSEGGAYVHNLFTGKIVSRPEPNRETPYHPAHTTAVAGLSKIKGGDDRFYNNIFVGAGDSAANTGKAAGFGLWVYDERELPLKTDGNVYYNGARPYARETNALTLVGTQLKPEIVETGDRVVLRLQLGPGLKQAATARVSTELLGEARIPNLPFENPDGSPLVVNRDFFGHHRSDAKPSSGPFENPGSGKVELEVWGCGPSDAAAHSRGGAVPPPQPFGPVPTERQLRWHEMEFYGFLHFTVNTFTDKEWGYGDEDEKVFNPTAFDAGQIVSVAKAAGMKGLILTAKHHDGFCLWPSKYTEHSVKNSPWKNRRGDVVKEISEACRRQGLKFGVYLSPWDRNHKDYGRAAYLTYYRNQLRELLTGYGDVFTVWFDGANGGDGYYGGARETRRIDRQTYYEWPETWHLVRELMPQAAMFSDAGPDFRWVGNERGFAGETCWATLNAEGSFPGGDARGLNAGERPGTHWLPPECDVSIRPGWFYHASQDAKVKTPEQLLEVYYKSVGRGAGLNLNLPPDRRGQIPAGDVQALREFRRILDKTFAVDLAPKAKVTASNTRGNARQFGPEKLTDRKRNTYWATDDDLTTPELIFQWKKPVRFNVVNLREHLPLGQRVEAFALDQWKDGQWVEFASGTSIGNRRLVRGEYVMTDRVRLRITQASVCPALAEVGFFAGPVLPKDEQ